MEEINKELKELKYAIVKGDGSMAWTPTGPALFLFEGEADDHLAMFRRLKHYGYRKVRLFYEDIETEPYPSVEGIQYEQQGSVKVILGANGTPVIPETVFHDIYRDAGTGMLVGKLGSTLCILTPEGIPQSNRVHSIYMKDGSVWYKLGGVVGLLLTGDTNYYRN